jgi:uncharacterized protein YgbK (DUF1537 family)
MPKLLVIADDLTGANDTGVQFAGRGISTLVVTDAAGPLPGGADRFEVLVVNTESRHLDPKSAAERVKTAVRRGREAGVSHFYKKTDSTLRGNVGSELEALLAEAGGGCLSFVPAYPKLGRTTRNGLHYVDGSLLHETAFARDPLNPITDSSLAAIVNRQTDLRVRIVNPSDPHDGEIAGIDEQEISVFNGATDDDLRRSGEWLKRWGRLRVLAGSAGFAEWLPDLMEFELSPVAAPSLAGPMLVVNGSVNEVSLNQIAHAQAAGWPVMELPSEALVPADGAESASARRLIAEIVAHDTPGAAMVLRSIACREDLDGFLRAGAAQGLTPDELHLRIAENTGRMVGQILRQAGFKLLVVFGGDTLTAISRACGWSGLLPRHEISPGIIVSGIAGEEGLWLITKAGGFGQETLLPEIAASLIQ